jgi:hypothetical protein
MGFPRLARTPSTAVDPVVALSMRRQSIVQKQPRLSGLVGVYCYNPWAHDAVPTAQTQVVSSTFQPMSIFRVGWSFVRGEPWGQRPRFDGRWPIATTPIAATPVNAKMRRRPAFPTTWSWPKSTAAGASTTLQSGN